MITRREMIRSGLCALCSAAIPLRAFARSAAPAPIPTLPLVFSVAERDGAAVRDDAWIGEQLAEVSRLYTPIGVTFRKTQSLKLPPALSQLETRDDRDSLAAHLVPKTIHVMIVASLRDVDDPRLYRMGVHWRHRKQPAKHYIIVAESARPSTLAHELGHFFGLDHSTVTDNLMSYSRTGAPPFLENKQEERIEAMARMYLSAKLLLPA